MTPPQENTSETWGSDDASEVDIEEARAEMAEVFDLDDDPLAELAPRFEAVPHDPFDMFVQEVLDPDDLNESTRNDYLRTIRQWRAVMDTEGRHPACPNEAHVKAFIRDRINEGNGPKTIKGKIRHLNRVYQYWQRETAFPHTDQFNPIQSAREKVDLSGSVKKEPPRIPIEALRGIMADVTHIRDRAIIASQLKLGIRATALCNVELGDAHIQNAELLQHYDEMGSHPKLTGRNNAIYIPSRNEREGNKSPRPRVLPLDEELQRVLIQYLLIRPDNGEPHVFLSQHRHAQLDRKAINRVWKDYFHPEYEETEEHRAVTSHFGRHRFTTYWHVEEIIDRERVKYMRGDKVSSGSLDGPGAIDEYLHTYYEDIEDIYRDRIFRLGL